MDLDRFFLAVADAETANDRAALGAVRVATAADGYGVYRAQSRAVARALKANGFKFASWRTHDGTVRGWH